MTVINMRSRILEVASRLFEERGIHGSGVDTIIAEAGIAKATLYKHFASKDTLVNAFLRSKADAFYDWLRSGPGQLVGLALEGAVDYRAPDFAAPVFLLHGRPDQARALTEELQRELDATP